VAKILAGSAGARRLAFPLALGPCPWPSEMPGPAVEAAARGGGCCGKTAGKWEKTYLDVLGICCTAEVALVERLLAPIHGVRTVTVVVPSRTVIVDHDTAAVSQFHIGNRIPLSFSLAHSSRTRAVAQYMDRTGVIVNLCCCARFRNQ
jgi:copper chaperone CopZ